MQAYQAIYLSPHLDDAVYSCGARIFTQRSAGQHVLVISVFTGSPPDEELTEFTRELKSRWGGVSDINAVRRAEDQAAAVSLGFDYRHLPWLDCVYRQEPRTLVALYPTVEHIFGDIHPAEAELPAELLAQFLACCADWHQATVYAPLAAGHHVDHLLVRQAALDWQRLGAEVLFYEDYPYSDKPEVTMAALAPFPAACRSPLTFTFDEAALRAKVLAAACYRSQLSTFWMDLEEMTAAFRAQSEAAARLVGRAGYAENYWKIPTGCQE